MTVRSAFVGSFVLLLVSLGLQCDSEAVLVFSHSGNADPTTEGWTENSPTTTGVTAFGVTNDGGSGVDAWAVDDNSTVAPGSTLSYSQIPTAAQHSDASANGWTLRTNVRVVDDANPGGSVEIDYGNGSNIWVMVFSAQANGDPTVVLGTGFAGNAFTGPTFTLTGAGSTYNLWELRFDANAGTADLFVNGVEQLSDYSGFGAGGIDRVLWGANASGDVGQGNWNLVQWEIAAIPEPSAFLFGGLVTIVLGFNHRKGADRPN